MSNKKNKMKSAETKNVLVHNFTFYIGSMYISYIMVDTKKKSLGSISQDPFFQILYINGSCEDFLVH